MIKIKSCPFCGAKAEADCIVFADNKYWHVECTDAMCGASSSICDTEEEAVLRWNRRTNECLIL